MLGDAFLWELENQDFWSDQSRNLFSFPIIEIEYLTFSPWSSAGNISFAVYENEKGSACY